MKINGWDISEANGKQWNVVFGNHAISNSSEWPRGSPIPALLKNEIGFKTIKIVIAVRNFGREAILTDCSEILSRLLKPAVLELDGYSHKFHGIMTKHSLEENPLNIPMICNNRMAKVTVEFNCYEYGERVSSTFTRSTTILLQNAGNINSPVKMEITPTMGVASLTVTGIARNDITGLDIPVVIKNVVKNEKIILNGETGIITKGGTPTSDIEIWKLPTVLPGENRITLSSNLMDVQIEYYPRYM